MNNKTARFLFLAIGVLAAPWLSGCSKHGPESRSAASAPDMPAGFQAPSAARLQLLRGADQQAIRAYLESVHEVKPKKFEVQPPAM